MGNVGSVESAINFLDRKCIISNNIEEILEADGYILPGVGAFPEAMKNLKRLDLIEVLSEEVINKKKPFFGICLGMQLLAKDSIEQGLSEGLGWIDGHVKALDLNNNYKVPHVGWNNVEFDSELPLFARIEENSHFYFDHSFHLECDKKLITSTCNYGKKYVASIQKENIFATQFHPEKSQRNGLKMLRNFLNLINSNIF